MTSYFSIFKATLINLPTPVGRCLVQRSVGAADGAHCLHNFRERGHPFRERDQRNVPWVSLNLNLWMRQPIPACHPHLPVVPLVFPGIRETSIIHASSKFIRGIPVQAYD